MIHRPQRVLGESSSDRRGVAWAGGVGAIAVVAALGAWAILGGGSDEEGTVPPPAASGETVAPTVDGAVLEGALTLSPGGAAVVGLEGTDAEAEWTSTDPSVAAVEGDRVEAVASGDAQLRTEVDGAVVTIPIAVRVAWTALEVRAADGSALGSPVVITEGGSVATRAVLVSDDGSEGDGAEAEWSSLDASVASVSGGAIRAESPGATVLTARVGDFEATVSVRVDATPAPRPPVRVPTPGPEPATPSGPGRLVILITPGWANAFLDGQPIGEYLSRYEIELEAGTYRLRLENPAFAPADTTVTIRPGETTRWERRLGNGSDS
ncbi:MAG: PEGA domain-containing protein [Gemmatimonadetes bacterium]|nr:PEGA domain-containing protein [Gemmatimonadota bacterium]